jgi:hypothetical protein
LKIISLGRAHGVTYSVNISHWYTRINYTIVRPKKTIVDTDRTQLGGIWHLSIKEGLNTGEVVTDSNRKTKSVSHESICDERLVRLTVNQHDLTGTVKFSDAKQPIVFI